MEVVKVIHCLDLDRARTLYIFEIRHRYKVEGFFMQVAFTLPLLMNQEEKDSYVKYVDDALASEYEIVRREKLDLLFDNQETLAEKRFSGLKKESLIIYDSPNIGNPEQWIAKGKVSWNQYRTILCVFYAAFTQIGDMMAKNLGVFIQYPADEELSHAEFIDNFHNSLGSL